ncbi:MAG: glycoside hydrolase family 31 protein [Thermoplasmatales archaeon]
MQALKKLEEMKSILDIAIIKRLEYALKRDELDKNIEQNTSKEFQSVGRIVEFRTEGNTINVDYEKAKLKISTFHGDILRVVWNNPKTVSEIVPTFQLTTPVFVRSSNSEIVFLSENVEIGIKENGSIYFYHKPSGITRAEVFQSGDGNVRLISEIPADFRIYGGGENAQQLNIRGSSLTLWNHDANGKYGPGDDPLYIGIPVFLHIISDSGYLTFFNSSHRCTADLCHESDQLESLEFSDHGLEYYISFGQISKLTEDLSVITGKPAMPPQWALGFHQSKYSYSSEREVLDLVKKFRENDLPISAVHLDIDYMDGFKVFTIDRSKFPNFPKMVEQLKTMGIRVVTIIDPGVKVDEKYEIFVDGFKNSCFVTDINGNVIEAPVWPGLTAFPDFTSEKVREWWASKYKKFIDLGVSGFWHDMNEPAVFTAWGDNTLPLSAKFEGGIHADVHNLYGLYMAKAGYQGIIKARPNERPFILSRSGWAGLQKYSWTWTGDTETSWAELKQTIATIINLGLSGIPFSGSDIGGFAGSPSNELFLRWFQMSAFFPLFRVHSNKGTRPREPWAFGKENMDILRKFLKLRYRIIPYLYTQAYLTSKTGHPIIRPLFWLGDPSVSEDDEKFLVGDKILVAPILAPGQTTKIIKLPKGEWIDFWSESKANGIVEIKVSKEKIPVYVRSGSIIPMQGENVLELHIYQGNDFSGELYVDDGMLNPEYTYYTFRGKRDNGNIKLEVNKEGNISKNLVVRIVAPNDVKTITIGKSIYQYRGDNLEVEL